ncbi:MAG: hypothetical protein ACPG8V_01575 [Alphaproteobacteria bacterium]
MSIQQLLENRSSTMQNKMTGGEVKAEHLKQALATTTTTPIHGKVNPMHFVVYDFDKRNEALDMLYKPRAEKMPREDFDANFGGVGAFVFAFIKKGATKFPDIESITSASMAVYGMQLSLINNGYCVKINSIFPDQANGASIMNDLGLSVDEYTPIGYLMIGTGETEIKERANYSEYTDWK